MLIILILKNYYCFQESFLFASTFDGILSVYNIIKSNKMALKFDRALNTIQRFKIIERNWAVSASRKR